MNKIVVICGPTSTGKTSLALKLCRAFNGEIISADSRQIYKYLDIGTGKLPIDIKTTVEKFEGLWKISGIPVYMYDIVSPAKTYSVYDYSKKAANELILIQKKQKIPFIVGGTGFYIDILTNKKNISNIPPDYKLRSLLETKTLEELQEMLRTIDKKKYALIDIKNKVRLIRAIEIGKGGGITPDLPRPLERSSNILTIGLSAPRNYLYERVDLWVEKIAERGLILETRKLLDMGFRQTSPIKSLVYSSVTEFLDEKITLEEMKQKIKGDLHGYIRRQLTWFNRNPEITWFNIAGKGFDIEVLKTVQSFLDGNKKPF